MKNPLSTKITPPRVDSVLIVAAGLAVLPLGVAVMLQSEHVAVGAMFVFIGIVNLFSAWRVIRKSRKTAEE